MRHIPAGRDAVLIDTSDEDDPAGWSLAVESAVRAGVERGELTGIADIVPTARAVMVSAVPGTGVDLVGVRRTARTALPQPAAAAPTDSVEISVVYDGADLSNVADALGTSPSEVVRTHTAIHWQVEFIGFAPGFGYLIPADDTPPRHPARQLASIARRAVSRPRVPAGSVAVAAGYTAVYPRQSPGGWHLIGHTERVMFDVDRDPPALLRPRTTVRFTTADSKTRR